MLPSTPYRLNLWRSFRCGTVSKALKKSNMIINLWANIGLPQKAVDFQIVVHFSNTDLPRQGLHGDNKNGEYCYTVILNTGREN